MRRIFLALGVSVLLSACASASAALTTARALTRPGGGVWVEAQPVRHAAAVMALSDNRLFMV